MGETQEQHTKILVVDDYAECGTRARAVGDEWLSGHPAYSGEEAKKIKREIRI